MQHILRLLVPVFFFSLIFSFSKSTSAQTEESAHGLYDRIHKVEQAGQEFQPVTLFAPTSGKRHTDVLRNETLLQPLKAQLQQVFQSKPEAISLSLSTESGKHYTLLLLRSYPTSEHPDMGVYDKLGRHRCSYEPGLHYQGIIQGEKHSMAAISIFSDAEFMGLFSNEEGNFNLGNLEDGTGRYILYNDQDMLNHPPVSCATRDDDERLPQTPVGIKTAKATNALECRKVRIYWEVDSTILRFKITLANTQNYVTGLFNQFQAMYANEHITVELSSMYIWDGLSIYPTTSSSAGLYTFTAFWKNLKGGFDGDLGHLLMKSGKGNGGIAWLTGISTTKNYSYAYSDINGSYSTIPTFSWTVEVVTHETGHNLSSHHTHWCGWMTNSGSCGAIDNCYTLETNTCSCTYAQYSNAAPVASWKGTVMSYCHLVSRGISLANGFGPLPGNQVRSYVSGLNFLEPTLGATLMPTAICQNDGAVTLQLPSSLYGTAPFHYSWSNGANSQNISALSTPGNYSVTVTDSNGCSNSFSTEVKAGRSSGTAETPIIAMPICCNRYNAPLRLQATPPQGLSSCQTVYWLRSKTSFTSTDDAKAYFDTAASVNVLPSTNDSSIADGVTGAELHVIPEPCNSTSSWYYTPVAVQRAHNSDSVMYTTTGSTSLLAYSNVQIGGQTGLPNQTNVPTACDLLDEPTVQSLRVIITGYTGRPDRLRIAITDSAGQVIYMSENLHGAGSYYIPDTLINGNMLQKMTILGFDYNCTTSTSTNTTTCTSSSCTVSAFRKVVFGAHPAKLTTDCPLSTPIHVVWAPNGCSMLAVQPNQLFSDLKVVPNPASSSARILFTLAQSAQLSWTMCDMTGRIILKGQGQYLAGAHEADLDLNAVAKGIYLISLSDGVSQTHRSKLVVE